jgi:Zn-dependent peptidase ImmA (M78 family)
MANNYYLQQKASAFRQQFGIGPCEPIRMKSWLPKLGILAMFKPLSEKFSGMAIKHVNLKFILINSDHRLSKQHFTIAHELYHLFIQEKFELEVTNAGKFDKKNKIEYEADCFAAYLLMPEDCLLSLIPKEELVKNKISLFTIVKAEQYFACSRKSLLFRLDAMGLIDFDKYKNYTLNVTQSARRMGYDDTLYLKGNEGLVIGDYGVIAKQLFDNDKISESHFISLMNDLGADISTIENNNEQE